MSETETLPHVHDDHEKVMKLREELKRAEFNMDQGEKLGKYDVTTPNDGEDTHASYHAKRPTEGIVRDGDAFRHAKTGLFSSEADYTSQNSTPEAHYDRLLEEKSVEYVTPDYESMSFMELAKEASKARQLGDRDELRQIREIAEHNLYEEATREGNDWTQEQFDDQMASFDRYVVRLDSGIVPVAVAPVEIISTADTAKSEKAEVSEEIMDFVLGQEVKVQRTSGVIESNWTISNFYTDAFGRRTYELSKDNLIKDHITDVQLASWQTVESVSDLSETDVVAGNADHEQPANENESFEEYQARNGVESPDGIDDLNDISTEPTEFNDGIDGLEDIVLTDRADTDNQSRRERLKSLWGNNKEKLKDYFRPNYWMAEWTTRRAINRDTREAMSDEERDKKRNRNRVILILGTTAGGIGVGIIGTLIVKGMIDASTVHSVGQTGGG